MAFVCGRSLAGLKRCPVTTEIEGSNPFARAHECRPYRVRRSLTMNDDRRMFKDRSEAGKLLAQKLASHGGKFTLVLALPRGGVPVGFEVAKALKAPLDTLVVRKLGMPGDPEFGVGAIGPGDTLVLDDSAVSFGIKKAELADVVAREKKELVRRIKAYGSGSYSKGMKPRTVIIVDDGVATGGTALAAIRHTKSAWPRATIVFAAPICARDTAKRLRHEADVVCVKEVDDLVAIGMWYEDFPQLRDSEVVKYVRTVEKPS